MKISDIKPSGNYKITLIHNESRQKTSGDIKGTQLLELLATINHLEYRLKLEKA